MQLTRRQENVISKHHMLLFNKLTNLSAYPVNEFQNIICYCLTQAEELHNKIVSDFKTSYVIV